MQFYEELKVFALDTNAETYTFPTTLNSYERRQACLYYKKMETHKLTRVCVVMRHRVAFDTLKDAPFLIKTSLPMPYKLRVVHSHHNNTH
jgi:hypothetical protein